MWYTALVDAGLNLDPVRDWVMLGWESVLEGSSPKHLFNPKLWKLGHTLARKNDAPMPNRYASHM